MFETARRSYHAVESRYFVLDVHTPQARPGPMAHAPMSAAVDVKATASSTSTIKLTFQLEKSTFVALTALYGHCHDRHDGSHRNLSWSPFLASIVRHDTVAEVFELSVLEDSGWLFGSTWDGTPPHAILVECIVDGVKLSASKVAVSVAEQAMMAEEYKHEAGILDHDIDPCNVLVRPAL
ncbi:hypothetical protein NEOLEDRAFT_1178715 [Neolentinus lepideus HHB14362 ss-1]|uniref:Protein kinase domain-containing protein n=1 Tax=Neolentinus lepideus HHB14362 ss-1 TaxID=1314782 RepID=A0A165SC54_9AGAM|nr:hypothetical protein NEOLEDRAFT_1178715 [Neolentinus lepideus HHB14362 ss-1]